MSCAHVICLCGEKLEPSHAALVQQLARLRAAVQAHGDITVFPGMTRVPVDLAWLQGLEDALEETEP